MLIKRFLILCAGLAVASGGIGCGVQARPLLVVALDGADWKIVRRLVQEGSLPTLGAFFKDGAAGRLEAEKPYAARMLWATALTGAEPENHRVYDDAHDYFLEPPLPKEPLSSRVPYFWERLPRGVRFAVVGYEDASAASRAANPGAARYAVKKLFHWDSLPLMPDLDEPPLAAVFGYERFPSEECEAATAEALQVTEAVFEEAGRLLAEGSWDGALVFLPGLDTVSHHFMHYDSPRMPHIGHLEHRLYYDGVLKFLQFVDGRLEKLLSHATASWNVAVVSAYGFCHGFERPYVSTEHAQLGSVEAWHSADGFFLLKGPDVRKVELKGAWVYDVAPTLLAFFGRRPEGPGRVLDEILKFPAAPLRRIKPAHPRLGPALSQGSTAVRARHLLETRRYALAESLLRPLAESEEESVWAFLMGRSAHRTGRLEEAGDWLELASGLWPEELSSIIELSRVREKQGQADEALELLGGLVQIYPEPDVYNAMADLYYNSFFCGQAEIYYRSATQIHIGQVLPYMRMAECLSRDGYLDEALNLLLESPLLYRAGFAYLAAGEAYLFHGKYDQALQAAADALKHDPDLWRAHLVRARALWAQGKKEDAEAAFEEAMSMAPRRPEPLYQKALLLHAARESQEAFRHMIDIAERFPEFVPALVKAGVWAAEKNKRSLARDMLQAALVLEPRNMEARYTFDAHFSKKNS